MKRKRERERRKLWRNVKGVRINGYCKLILTTTKKVHARKRHADGVRFPRVVG